MNEQSAKDFLDQYVEITRERDHLRKNVDQLAAEIVGEKEAVTKRTERMLTNLAYEIRESALGFTRDDAKRLVRIFEVQTDNAWSVEGDDDE